MNYPLCVIRCSVPLASTEPTSTFTSVFTSTYCIVNALLPIEMSVIHGFMGWQVGDLDGSTGKKRQKSGMASSAGNCSYSNFWSQKLGHFLAWGTQEVENKSFKKQ